MKSKTFKLIGYKIKNSASPFIHKKIFEHKKKNHDHSYSYKLLDTKPSDFDQVFPKLNNFSGVNITSPYKIQAFNKLKLKSQSALHFSCVNTIKTLPNGKLKGFCTDGFGFLKSLATLKTDFFENILILGFGGAGLMALKCLEDKCENLYVAVRNLKKIPKKIKTKASFLNLNYFNEKPNISNINFQLIVNTTTCGNSNNPNTAAIDLTKLKNFSNVFDLIYYPLETKLLKQAKKLNAKTINGVSMLIWQAVAAQKIWNNFDLTNNFIKHLISETENFLNKK